MHSLSAAKEEFSQTQSSATNIFISNTCSRYLFLGNAVSPWQVRWSNLIVRHGGLQYTGSRRGITEGPCCPRSMNEGPSFSQPCVWHMEGRLDLHASHVPSSLVWWPLCCRGPAIGWPPGTIILHTADPRTPPPAVMYTFAILQVHCCHTPGSSPPPLSPVHFRPPVNYFSRKVVCLVGFLIFGEGSRDARLFNGPLSSTGTGSYLVALTWVARSILCNHLEPRTHPPALEAYPTAQYKLQQRGLRGMTDWHKLCYS